MELPFKHSLRFTNDGPIKLSELADTLVAHEIAFALLPKILEKAIPGLIVDKFSYELLRINRSSPSQEDFAGQFYFRVQKTIEDYISALGEQTGFESMKTHSHALSLVVLAMLLVGGTWLTSRLLPTSQPQISINGDNNVVITLAAESLGVSPDALEGAIEQALSNRERRQLERAAAEVFTPSKSEPEATVELPGLYRVSPETAKAIPTLEMLEDAEPIEEYENLEKVQIIVRATNLDDREQGWAGVLVMHGKTRRLRLLWPKGIDLEYIKRISNDMPVIADVRIIYRPNRRSEMVPKVAEITKLHLGAGLS